MASGKFVLEQIVARDLLMSVRLHSLNCGFMFGLLFVNLFANLLILFDESAMCICLQLGVRCVGLLELGMTLLP